ncbi:MAG: PelD GGDEF domain-containing protein [Steroidobacteraceae bacterium]|nr:PelD GGDEF domain-containing protein [Deltaproteobacteria bacterium]
MKQINPGKSRLQKAVPWLETVGITLLAPAIGALLDGSDPFFLKATFPWLWFGPLLVALRYGIAMALTSVSLLALLWLGMSWNGLTENVFPLNFMLGGTLLALIAGQFSSVWSNRLRLSNQLSRHATERFEQLSRAYFMVRLSHDRLEQNLISRPVTLRQAMTELRRLMTNSVGALNSATCGELMSILVNYCSLTSAALYPVQDDRILTKPLAKCGQESPCLPDDLLLQSAMESGHTAYQSADRLREEQHSLYLVAAPLTTSSGKLLGVLLVTDMPFMALHRETLQILGVLLAYAADHVEAAGSAGQLLAVYPDCPTIFGAELFKLVRLRRDLEISSALMVISISPQPRREEICLMLERQLRGLDHGWRRDLGWAVQYAILMPFSGPAATEGYMARLGTALHKQFNLGLENDGISCRFVFLTAEEPLHQLAGLLVEER